MPTFHVHGLPPSLGKGATVKWLSATAGIAERDIGAISYTHGHLRAEIRCNNAPRIARALNRAVFEYIPVEAWCEDETVARSPHNSHFLRLLRLIALEAAAEVTRFGRHGRHLPETGFGKAHLTNLSIRESYVGAGARVHVLLGSRNTNSLLPFHRLRAGGPVVCVRSDKTGKPSRAVVGAVDRDTIEIILSSAKDAREDGERYDLFPSPDDVSRGREREAIERIRQAPDSSRAAALRDHLLNPEVHAADAPPPCATPVTATLNPSQEAAAVFALNAIDLAMIHGPPGTGKTTTVVAVIRRAVAQGRRVLAMAPSNLAVDNMLTRMTDMADTVLRLGHAARVTPKLQRFGLNQRIEQHRDFAAARDLWTESRRLHDAAHRDGDSQNRKAIQAEATRCKNDARSLERQILQSVVDAASVVFSTLHGLDPRAVGGRMFDLGVIDEACQCTEPACWIPVVRCGALLLAGDHWQLPPTVISQEAVSGGLGVSMFERLMKLKGPGVSRRLEVQYRMHQDIMAFSSATFYDGALEAAPGVGEGVLADLPHVAATDLTMSAVHFIDTAGSGSNEEAETDTDSVRNIGEARLVCRKIDQLRDAGVKSRDIAVIAPYAAQVRCIDDFVGDRTIEVNSIDGFQGRESDVVVISLVRSNREGKIGFLADVRRMNVALTRARRKLIVIGDSATISHNDFYSRMLDYFDRIGAYSGVWDETP